MMNTDTTDRKLREQLMLSRRVEGDRLMLADGVMQAALDGSRHLTAGERAALMASPLTLRRFRVLSTAGQWRASGGMLRAAADGAALSTLTTDDGFWTLHFVGDGANRRVILALDAAAPFAGRLLREQAPLRVLDGGGAIILQGSLDADAECETAWPFESDPASHFHAFGATFAVERLHRPS